MSRMVPPPSSLNLQEVKYLQTTAELCYNIMKGTDYFVSLQMSVVLTTKYNVMFNSDESIGTTEHVMSRTR